MQLYIIIFNLFWFDIVYIAKFALHVYANYAFGHSIHVDSEHDRCKHT